MDPLSTRLDVVLHRPTPTIGDDGFSDSVMRALPRKRFTGAQARRWTLGGAAVAGGLITALLGAPLENAFGSLFVGGVSATSVLAVLFVAIVAVPTVWAFYSE